MLVRKLNRSLPSLTILRRAAVFIFGIGLVGMSQTIMAQTFNSGSTGSDGAFSPTTSQSVQLPPGGIFNYTTINIPSGVTITFKRNAANTPVTLLASGNVTIAGTIDISGGDGLIANVIGSTTGGGIGGPGGFNGGRGGTTFDAFSQGVSGSGPGGGGAGSQNGQGGGGGFNGVGNNGTSGAGGAVNGQGGLRYGTKTLLVLIGGSGGGGGGGINGSQSAGGGGGGGSILIASSGTITLTGNGLIQAPGGATTCIGSTAGGGGSGGAIRLVATTITGDQSRLTVSGGAPCTGANGAPGYVRIEAYNFVNFTLPVVSPAAALSTGPPSVAVLPAPPGLQIVSVGGLTAPATPGGSYSSPDLTIPNTQTNPVTVALKATNVPQGTAITLTMQPENGTRQVVQSSPVDASGNATASVSLPVGVSVITATVFIDLTTAPAGAQSLMIEGERVVRVETEAVFGGATHVIYVTENGRRITLK